MSRRLESWLGSTSGFQEISPLAAPLNDNNDNNNNNDNNLKFDLSTSRSLVSL